MLTPRDAIFFAALVTIGLWGVSMTAIRSLERFTTCSERTADGAYVLQRVAPSPTDDDRTRKIVDQHNRILELECGR